MDEEGYTYLTDRKTVMSVSGAANIHPAKVQSAIDAHPAAGSSVVIGLPDEDPGQVIHALVDATADVSEEELLAFLAERLARHKIPRSIEFVRQPLRDDADRFRRSALLQERLQTQG